MKKAICFGTILLIGCSAVPEPPAPEPMVDGGQDAAVLDAGVDAAGDATIQETCFAYPGYAHEGEQCDDQTPCPASGNPCKPAACIAENGTRCTAADLGDGQPGACPPGLWCVGGQCCPTAPPCIYDPTNNCYTQTPCVPPRGCVDGMCCL